MEPTDWHAKAEDELVTAFGKRLDRYPLDGKLGDLVVVAPTKTLGVLRQALGHAKSHVRAEFDKDYVDAPVHDIEKHLQKLLRGE
jgi:protein required for attachment to host cells